MDKKGQNLVTALGFVLVLFLFLVFTSNLFGIQREVIFLKINNGVLDTIQLGFQNTPLKNTFFENIPSGDFRLYIESKSRTNQEIAYTYSRNNIGNGVVFISDIKFPMNDTWNIKIELKNKNLQTITSRCFEAKFDINETQKSVIQKEIACNQYG